MPDKTRRRTHPKHFLSDDESARVARAIERAEQTTSAEIKLIVARHCWGSLQEKAQRLFFRHGLHRTKERNCVLILLVSTNRELALFGDRGIHRHVGESFWIDVAEVMLEAFREDRIAEGACDGIRLIGERLAAHFPIREDDVNELSDEVAHED